MTTALRPCPHHGCPGRLTPSGFCLATGLRVDLAAGRHSGVETARAPRPRRPRRPPPGTAVPDIRVTLPRESPNAAGLPRLDLPRGAAPVRAPAGPRLAPGTVLAGQYRVVSHIGYGGLGQVYLAEDGNVDGRRVAVKILLQEAGADGGPLPPDTLSKERRMLVELNHDDIIRVYNYGSHPGAGDFLVLQYVDGPTLSDVRAAAAAGPERFGGARFHEFVLGYGIRVLSALGYLHARGRVYGDLKPANVMHDGTATKIIDVGSVRAEGDPGPTTDGFRAPLVGARGESLAQDDLYSLGMTLCRLSGLSGEPVPGTPPSDEEPGAVLERLAGLATLEALADPLSPESLAAAGMTTPAPQGLGLVSLARVLRRAGRRAREDRFATALEMEQQLHGVFRELRSLRTREETFEPSPLFSQSPYALDGELGAPPALWHWDGDEAAARVREYTPPPPTGVAQRLPVPRPDRDDEHWADVDRLTDDAPRALLQRIGGWSSSPEVHLLRCRLQVRAGLRAPAETAGRLRRAREELAAVKDALGEAAAHDWRIDWHEGLLALADDDVGAAHDRFDRVYAAIPGEYAPKLALGFCSEHQGRTDRALVFYEAVRLRNPSLGAAAFGCARALLRRGPAAGTDGPGGTGAADPRAAAIRALEAVPQHSRHRTAARTAAVRIRVHHAEDAADLRLVLEQLSRLFSTHGLTDDLAQLRMRAEVWERANTLLVPRGTRRARLSAEDLGTLAHHVPALRLPGDPRALRADLSRCYRELALRAARSAPGDDLAERLLDRAYQVRPLSFRHGSHPSLRDDRDSTWTGKRIRAWLRKQAVPSRQDGERQGRVPPD